MSITTTRAWADLQKHQATIATCHLRDLFAADPGRCAALTVESGGLHFDYSKQRVNAETLALLVALAERMHAPQVAGAPRGLDELRAAYRLTTSLSFEGGR